MIRQRGSTAPLPPNQASMPVISVAAPRFLALIILLSVGVPLVAAFVSAGFAIRSAVGKFGDAMDQAGGAFGRAAEASQQASEAVSRVESKVSPRQPTGVGRYISDPTLLPTLVRANVNGEFKLRWLDIARSGARAQVELPNGEQSTVRLSNDGKVERVHEADANDPLFELDDVDFEQASKVFADAQSAVGPQAVMIAAIMGVRDGKVGWEVLVRDRGVSMTVRYRNDGTRLGSPKTLPPRPQRAATPGK
ncbi:MAG: hypothetical protein AAF721_32005 [Myxococcota bacterium]